MSEDDSAFFGAKDDGYRGLWYKCGYAYSGGLGTYCAKHRPFAVYCEAADKTFFCYGGTTRDSYTRLLHMVSYYDHRTGLVPRPTILLDKMTDDGHDNPVIALDDRGHIWVFSTSHGTARPSYVHRSRMPYDVAEFERVEVQGLPRAGEGERQVTNFSYMQPWHVPGTGFLCFFTHYHDPVCRTIFFGASPDGVKWRCTRLGQIEAGHYQISFASRARAATAFNYHPAEPRNDRGVGSDWRTNLYYVETPDGGETWHTADRKRLTLPLMEAENPALVRNYEAEGLSVYLKDIRFDRDGMPVILFLTSKGPQPGPASNPRVLTTARWTGSAWEFEPVTTTDHNYDMGPLYIEDDGTWRIIAPTDPGPQPGLCGGEMVVWISNDRGKTWRRAKQLTRNSSRNHTYARQPVNAHPGLYALWADGDPTEPSPSRLYVCDREGNVRRLPAKMKGDASRPRPLKAR